MQNVKQKESKVSISIAPYYKNISKALRYGLCQFNNYNNYIQLSIINTNNWTASVLDT